MDISFIECLLWPMTAIIIRYKRYSIIIAHRAAITLLPYNLITNGIAAPITYAGNVTACLVLNPRHENISYKLMHVTSARAAGKIYVSENHKIGKSIITATTEVIILFNI